VLVAPQKIATKSSGQPSAFSKKKTKNLDGRQR